MMVLLLLVAIPPVLGMITPPSTIVRCEINEEILYPDACLNEDCSIKAYAKSHSSEGDCWDVDCTRIVTKEEAEKARLNNPYFIGDKSENYYIGSYIKLNPETEFPPFEVINNICKEDLTEIKEWLTGNTSKGYVTIELYTPEQEKELQKFEPEMREVEGFKDPTIPLFLVEKKGAWMRVTNYWSYASYQKQSTELSEGGVSPTIFWSAVALVIIILALIWFKRRRRA